MQGFGSGPHGSPKPKVVIRGDVVDDLTVLYAPDHDDEWLLTSSGPVDLEKFR